MLSINTILATKDGRKCGNAIIVGYMDTLPATKADYRAYCRNRKAPDLVYQVVTDYGSRMCLTEEEVEELFYTLGTCSDDHKHRNLFYPGNGRNFGELTEDDFEEYKES